MSFWRIPFALDRVGIVEWFRPASTSAWMRPSTALLRLGLIVCGLPCLGRIAIRRGARMVRLGCCPGSPERWSCFPASFTRRPRWELSRRRPLSPRNPQDFADFLDAVVDRYGQYFEWVDLWNEPNNLNDWDWHLDRNGTCSRR